MSWFPFLNLLPLFVIGVSAALVIYVLIARTLRTGRGWLVLTLLGIVVTAGLMVLPPAVLSDLPSDPDVALTLALAVLLIAFGGLMLRDILDRDVPAWWASGLVWLALIVGAVVASPAFSVGERGWLVRLFAAPDAPGVIVLVGFLLAAALLPGLALYGYYRASLPEIGNRALLWMFQAVVILCGCALLLSGTEGLMQAGVLALLLGGGGSVYMQTQHRAFDLTSRLRFLLHFVLMLALTTVVIAAAIVLADFLGLAREAQAAALILVFALLVALVYAPLRQGVELLTRGLRGREANPTAAARRYSQQITRSLDLRQLVGTVVETLTEVMDVRRAGLMLVNAPDPDARTVTVRLLPNGIDAVREMRIRLANDNPVYRHWQGLRAPLTQYDIEYKPDYGGLSDAEKTFFRETGMHAYAPIIVDAALIGVLVCGPKRDDRLYSQRDLDLLATMADQTGVALRNARLVADLRQLNDNAQVLNRGLAAAKEQMEKLDAVKTDFITIASHELRTPLAQIKGYIDVTDALNNQGILDQDGLSEHLNNMRKAGDRIEELISAMLDVSQLDLKSMDLRFAESSLESILRMAVEPLIDVARQRKLSMVVRGLRSLPMIEGDMQRLVQAFRNVLVNAIKFTPDGGRIDVRAELLAADESRPERVVVSVADTGVGIDKENLELIFNKFYRAADPSLHSTGTYKFMGAGPGLGLTITRGIIEGHGGRIWVESPGHDMETCPGSTFYIELPLRPTQEARRAMTFGESADPFAQDLIETTVVRGRRDA